MIQRLRAFALIVLALTTLAGCQSWYNLKEPSVQVTGLRLLPSQGFQQRIAVDLNILNPNDRDLSLRGISYSIDINNIKLLEGASRQVPVLKAYEQTAVTLEVTAGLVEAVRIAEQVMRNGLGQGVDYRLEARLDFTRFLPDMTVIEEGRVPLTR
ncbi:LEA type 2 family protein [Marinimicrobium alkaliphilum]|uniref:LEA type 2 family protein n=1 Tax=Marinimicrobium alkaliphilum TaxID=2202654 RepID=UPI0013009420|nr:LEA type 2 family protein [Marinimicrobium alkaliphilum]